MDNLNKYCDMKKTSFLYTLGLTLLAGCILMGCNSGSPRSFAEKLATQIAVLVNGGPTDTPTMGGDRTFIDPNYQLKLIQTIPGGTLRLPGIIEFKDYESSIGKLNGRLDWQVDHILPAGAGMWDRVPWDYAVHTLRDTLINDDGDDIAIDVQFKTPRGKGFPSAPYDVDAIEVHGTVKVGSDRPVEF